MAGKTVSGKAMASVTVENYLKHIYVAQEELGGERVPMGQIARNLGVTPGTATTMVKTLARQGMLEYEPRGGAQLTDPGRSLALKILRRHRLIEFFLVDKLKMDWREIHAEAEKLEHAISDRLLEQLDAYLGHPEFDPHGDAIPTANGTLARRELRPLAEANTGEIVRVARLSDTDNDFLDFAARKGLTPGRRWRITARDMHAACLTLNPADEVTPAEQEFVIALSAAERISVEV
ncbi:MAG: metal-dependent transcriptional regulator [Opitutales bacterium]